MAAVVHAAQRLGFPLPMALATDKVAKEFDAERKMSDATGPPPGCARV
jgi:hypothetical protein